MLKEKFLNILEFLNQHDKDVNYENVEWYIKNLAEYITGEQCIIYIDLINDDSTYVEVHFSDYNYYEIDIDKKDKIEDINKKVLRELIVERDNDLRNPNINRNNERYYKKYCVHL